MPSDDVTADLGSKRAWTLDTQAFERLLAALDDDRQRAALVYEQLRRRLIGLLQWWGAHAADELADETLDRMARKLDEGAVIASGSIGAYARGIARLVYYEWTRRPRSQPVEIDPPAVAPSEAEGAALTCFDRCLASLDAGERQLVLRYYDAGKAKDVRRRLADDAGISITALRIRVHRLRERLEQCTRQCLEGSR
jgi:DNA-directed RNA polymerase specialized sigma24 family protein